MSDPWNWCNPPSVPSLGAGCPPCKTPDNLLTAKYQPDSAAGWGFGPSRCLFRLISALWQRYHVMSLNKPDFTFAGTSFLVNSESFLRQVSVLNGYDTVLAAIHARIFEVGVLFHNLDGSQVTHQDLLGWGIKETGHHYPDDCHGALRALWNLRYRKAVALQVSGVFRYCPFDRKGAVSLQWKVPSYANCRRLLNPRLVGSSATQGVLSLSGDDNSFIQVLYRLDRPANAFVRQVTGVTRVTQVPGRYLRAYAPNHFDERLYVERSEMSFTNNETGGLDQQLLTTRHYIGPQAAMTDWQESQSSDDISSEDLTLGGTNPRLGVHIHPGINVLLAPLDQAYDGLAWRIEGNLVKRPGEPADVTRNVKEIPWDRLLFATDNSGHLDFEDFTQPGYEGKPWNDLDLLEAVFAHSDDPQITIGDKVYLNRGSVPWMVPGIDQVSFTVEGVTIEIPFEQDDAVGEVPAFETGFWTQPRLVIIQRSPKTGDTMRACFTAPVFEDDSPDPLSWTARVIASRSPGSQQVQQVGGGVLVSDLTCFNFGMPGFMFDGSLTAGTLKLEVLFSNGRSLSDFVQVCSLVPGADFELMSSSSSHSSESSIPVESCQAEFIRRMGDYKFLDSDSISVYAKVPPPTNIVGGSWGGDDGDYNVVPFAGCPSFILKPERSSWDPRWRLQILHVFAFPDGLLSSLFHIPSLGEISNNSGQYPSVPSWDVGTGGGYGYVDWASRRTVPWPGCQVYYQGDFGDNRLYTNYRDGRSPIIYHITEWALDPATNLQLLPLAYYDQMFSYLDMVDAIPALDILNFNPLLIGEMYAIWRLWNTLINSDEEELWINTPIGASSEDHRVRFDGVTEASYRMQQFIKRVLGFNVDDLHVFVNPFDRWLCSAIITCQGRPHPIMVRDLGAVELSSDERESSGGPDERSSSSSSSQSDNSSSSSSESFECITQPISANLGLFNWMINEISTPDPSAFDSRWMFHVVHRFTLSPTDTMFDPVEWGDRIAEMPNVWCQYDGDGSYVEIAWYKSYALEPGAVQTAALSDTRSLFDPESPPVPDGAPGLNGLYESYPLIYLSEADFKGFFLNNLGINMEGINFEGSIFNLLVATTSEITLGCPGWVPPWLPSGEVDPQSSSSSSQSVPESESSVSEASSASLSSASSASSASSNSSSSSSSPSSNSSHSSLSEISSSSSSSPSSNSSSSASSASSHSSLSELSSSSSSSNSSSSSSTVCANQTLAAVSSPNGHAFRHDPTTPALVDWHPNWKIFPVFTFVFTSAYTNSSSVITPYNWASRLPGVNPTGWSFAISEGELYATWARPLTVDFSQTYQTAALATVTAAFAALISATPGSDGNGGFTKFQWSASSTGAARLDFVTNSMGLNLSGLSGGTAPGTWFSDVNFPITLWSSINRFTC